MVEHLHLNQLEPPLYAAAAGPKDGPLVVLLHGFPEMSYAWRAQIGPLAEAGLRVVAPDQRGYGWSGKPAGVAAYALDRLADDIVRLAASMGWRQVRLVGHDWGGIVAWALAARADGFVERAVILNAPYPGTLLSALARHPGQALRSAYVGLFQWPWLPEAALRAGDFRLLELALTGTSRRGTFSPQELAVYRTAWRQPGALTGMLNWYRAWRSAPDLGTRPVRPPIRLLWGDRDAALDPALADMAMDRCANAELCRLPQASHWLHHEEPHKVNLLLLDFLR